MGRYKQNKKSPHVGCIAKTQRHIYGLVPQVSVEALKEPLEREEYMGTSWNLQVTQPIEAVLQSPPGQPEPEPQPLSFTDLNGTELDSHFLSLYDWGHSGAPPLELEASSQILQEVLGDEAYPSRDLYDFGFSCDAFSLNYAFLFGQCDEYNSAESTSDIRGQEIVFQSTDGNELTAAGNTGDATGDIEEDFYQVDLLTGYQESSTPSDVVQGPTAEEIQVHLTLQNNYIEGPRSPEGTNACVLHFETEDGPSCSASTSFQVGENPSVKDLKRKLRKSLGRPFPSEIIVEGIPFTVMNWAKAYIERSPVKAAMILFKRLFLGNEVARSSKSARSTATHLDTFKCQAILKAVWWMQKKNRNPYPLGSIEYEDAPDWLISLVNRKVFIQKRNEIRIKSGFAPVIKRTKIEKKFKTG